MLSHFETAKYLFFPLIIKLQSFCFALYHSFIFGNLIILQNLSHSFHL